MRKFNLLPFLLLCYTLVTAQVNYTANDVVTPYENEFGFGVNMGAYAGWTDDKLADIAVGNPDMKIKGAGVNTLRVSLNEDFLEYWGYDIRREHFKHYADLGATENVVFVGYPSDVHRDQTRYCDYQPSQLFANLYEPIWDDGLDGTPINDENYFARYLYHMVSEYKDYVRYWEIWNEPDFAFDYSAALTRNEPGNWWHNNPDPCHYALHAPIFHYVRMLRVAYDVIKTIAPETYVAVGGLGYPNWLDAVMRNTDNPVDGSVTAEYPLKGGAFFDVLSYHTYPHIDGSLRYWNNDIKDFSYTRHSDAAIEGVIDRRDDFEEVLFSHGYDGEQYPEKLWIITETNLPRKGFENKFGSDAAQRNFTIKVIVESQKNNIDQVHFYQLGEIEDAQKATDEYQLMGLYKNLMHTPYQEQIINQSGIALRTTRELLKNAVYDPERTKALNFSTVANGGAFRYEDGTYIYVLWAETAKDNSESTRHIFQLPPQLEHSYLRQMEWNFTQTKNETLVNAQYIELTGAPVFLRPTNEKPLASSGFPLSLTPNPFSTFLNLDFYLELGGEAILELYDATGRKVADLLQGEKLPKGAHQIQLETPNLPNGVYVVKFTIGQRVSTKRVILAK